MTPTAQDVTGPMALGQFICDQGPNCLIVARHGETAWNAEGRLQGQWDIPLNSRGRSQALAIARFLSKTPLVQVHTSSLRRSRQTTTSITEANIGGSSALPSDLLMETTLGVLEGELKERQSTAELTRHYKAFCKDEVNYRVLDGENLHDVAARVKHFFVEHDELLKQQGVHLIVGHRNLNKMILKHLLGLSFEEGFQVEQEHQRLYLYFGDSKELWSCWVDNTAARLTLGYVTTVDSSYA